MVRGPLPHLSTPRTPVPATPVCTSMPHSASRSATIFDVRCSSKPSSGCMWMSRRSATKREVSANESTNFMDASEREFRGAALAAAHALHHLHQAAALHLLHHALHLVELVEQAVDFLHLHA